MGVQGHYGVTIRKAIETESKVLTEISFLSKQYWNYPSEYFDVWKNELTITPSYIEKNLVYVAEMDGEVVGYLSVVEVEKDFQTGGTFVKKGFWLEHIFIKPAHIGKGTGTKLISFVKNICKKRGIRQLYIFSDPNSKGFYEKKGAIYIKEVPSNIKGRTVSLFKLVISP